MVSLGVESCRVARGVAWACGIVVVVGSPVEVYIHQSREACGAECTLLAVEQPGSTEVGAVRAVVVTSGAAALCGVVVFGEGCDRA